LEQTIPSWFLDRWSCGLMEWPDMGRRQEEPSPADMDNLLDEVGLALEEATFVAVIGFCLGGVVAWEQARRHSDPPALILIESPFHFPLVLAPILIPALGPWGFRCLTRTGLGRFLVERLLFRKGMEVPRDFWEAFGQSQPTTAQAYLKILRRYERSLPLDPDPPPCTCLRVAGRRSPRFLTWPWGRVHRIQAEHHVIEEAGHFPASEAPEAFFKYLDEHLSAAQAGSPG
jgi:pimeloyl-ACP methyl ester carboxylesterase